MSDLVEDRPYQHEARDAVFGKWEGGEHSTLLILPTGTGKTVVAGMIARQAKDEHNRRTLFLAHREELILQAQDKLSRFDLDCAIEMADNKARSALALYGQSDVVIATVQTLQNKRLESWGKHDFGIIVTDEAHHGRARTYRNIYDYFQGYWHLGITATPDRGDRKNLGAVYKSLAYEYSLRDAINQGFLVPLLTAQLRTGVDLRNVRTTGGDFKQTDLEARISPHVEQLARAMQTEMGSRRTVVFMPDVGSSEAMADALRQLGMDAQAVSGKTPKLERRSTLKRFSTGDHQVVVCCDLLIEGWDEPAVSCVVVCRPTKLRSRYTQMVGRGTRPHPPSGKTDCLIVDFAWETTEGHKLCTPVDLFDDSKLGDEVYKVARKLLEDGTVKDPNKALEEAEEIIRVRNTFKVKLADRTAFYQKVVYDPVGVGSLIGVRFRPGTNLSYGGPATQKQQAYLHNLGVMDQAGISKYGAIKMIDQLVKRRDAGLASVKQIGALVSLGADPVSARELKYADAALAIKQLSNRTKVG